MITKLALSIVCLVSLYIIWMILKTKSIKELAKTNLDISHLMNCIIIEHAVFLEEKLYQLQFMSSEERYKALTNVGPEILQKVSLTDIASYLGVSRETLSRIRKKK